MELLLAVEQRKSVRAFRSEKIPREVLEEILRRSLRAPSWADAQPWRMSVVGGETLDNIRRDCLAAFDSGLKPAPEIEPPGNWPEELKGRQKLNGRLLFDAMDIGRDDQEARRAYTRTMYGFFGSPTLVLLLKEQSLSPWSMLDLGLLAENIMLTAQANDVASCIAISFVNYPQIIRKYITVPENHQVVVGIALGYEDPKARVNRHRSPRASLDQVCSWWT